MKRALAHFVKVEDGVYGIVATAGVVQWVGGPLRWTKIVYQKA